MNKKIFSSNTVAMLRRAFALSSKMGHSYTGTEHILWSITSDRRSAAGKALSKAGVDSRLVLAMIEKYNSQGQSSGMVTMSLTAEANQVLDAAEAQMKEMKHEQLEPEHILIGMLKEKGSAGSELLISINANTDRIVDDVLKSKDTEWPRTQGVQADKGKKQTENLEEFTVDLSEMALTGKLDPLIGRDKEVERVTQILSRRTKNNPVLIGEPGVGKTAIAEGLAQRIVDNTVPETLEGMRVLSLDLGKMVSGTKYRGDFEERIKNFLEELKENDHVILFIDELHTLIGAGAAEGSLDAASVFKPALSRGEIQVIGATTLDEYRKHIEKDAALERRFQPVMVNEPTQEDAIKILHGVRPYYEEHHKLAITDEAVDAAVELGSRYIPDRFLPDKAIDLIDEAASRVRTHILTTPEHLQELEEEVKSLNHKKQQAAEEQRFEDAAKLRDKQEDLKRVLASHRDSWSDEQDKSVSAENVAEVVSMWTGIPVTMLTEEESERLMKLEDTLHERIVGQEDAVKAVSKAIRRSRVGIREEGHPIGSFMFLGPTGVGKTEVCKALAESMFADEDAIIRLDMSEYMERHTVSKLIGSPPGYVGYDEGGQLTEQVRRKPYSIVLFDEIEKAHPDVWNSLLQIMDEGRLTDAQGRTVDFKNTVIVMTSNLGARDIMGKASLGFADTQSDADGTRPQEEIRGKVMDELKRTFQPEFLNRLDEIVVFHQLDKDHISKIAYKMLDELKDRSSSLGIELTIEDSAVDILADRGFDPVFGARPLKRTIQSSLEDVIAETILEGDYTDGDGMVVTGEDSDLKIKLVKQQTADDETVSV